MFDREEATLRVLCALISSPRVFHVEVEDPKYREGVRLAEATSPEHFVKVASDVVKVFEQTTSSTLHTKE